MHDDSWSNHRGRTAGVAWLIRVVLVTLYLPVHGCDTVDGGAVELSWKLRPASSSLADKFVECRSGQAGTGTVTSIRLHWELQDADGIVGSQAWPCDDNHGATGFELAEGRANLWVTPECACPPGADCPDGAPAATDTYIAPARVQRTVIRGNTVSLGAVEIVVSVSDCGAKPCICCAQPPCT